MSTEKWYLGRVNRARAEELVTAAQVDGSFVVRASESIVGAYALSVWFNKAIHTYRILPTENGLLAVQTIKGVQQRKFVSLTELITEYKNSQNGLVCGLTNPVGAPSDIQTPAPPPPSAAPLPVLRMSSVPAQNHSQPSPTTAPLHNTFSPRPGAVRVLPSDTGPPPLLPQREPTPSTIVKPPTAQPNETQTHYSLNNIEHKDNTVIKNKFIARANRLRDAWPHENHGLSFMDTLDHYASDGVIRDMNSCINGSQHCVELQKLLAREAGQLESELELFLDKIHVLRQLVDLDSDVTNIQVKSDRDVDLESFLTRLGDCGTIVKSFRKRACQQLQMAGGIKPKSPGSNRTVARKNSILIEQIFEVKTDAGLKTVRQKLKVDVHGGRLILIKNDGMQEFRHTDVIQIVKNNKSQNKLSVYFVGGKKRDFTFERSTQREAFCQLMQYMINLKSGRADPDAISIFVGTWNMGDAMPPSSIQSWFTCKGSGKPLDDQVSTFPHELYVIGTQETGMPEKDWCQRVIDTIYDITGEKMHQVCMDALWHIKIIVLVKEEHKHRISHVRTSAVRTGIANTLGNKGAIAVSLQFGGTPLCFINAHLTSGNEKCLRRNQNYHDIMKQLNLGNEQLTMFDLANRFEHLIFIGDLNYRLEMENTEILTHLKKNRLDTLYKVDQLRREKELNKVFFGFKEEEILFPPTYRYERGSRDAYSHLKIKRTGVRTNVPSWCDRVLWKSYPDTHIVCRAYGCTDDIMTSDHSPVFASFQVGVRGQYVSNEGIRRGNENNSDASISFDYIEMRLKNATKNTNYFMEIRSTCLTEAVSSERITIDMEHATGNIGRLYWKNSGLPTLVPIIGDSEYLVDQHLMVAVRSDDDDYLLEFVLALRSMIGTEPQDFHSILTRRGESAGHVQGRMHVATSCRTRKVREKTYEFIQIDAGVREEANQAAPTAIYSSVDETPSLAPKVLEPKRATTHVGIYNDVPTEQKPNHMLVQRCASGPPSSKTTPSSSPNSTTSRDLNSPLPLPRNTKPREPSANLDAVFAEFDLNAETLFQVQSDPKKNNLSPSFSTPLPSQPMKSQRNQAHAPPPPANPAPLLPSNAKKGIKRHNSVNEFLKSIGMGKYATGFYDSGWDSYEFLSDLTEEDLVDCGIEDKNDSDAIMNAISNLR